MRALVRGVVNNKPAYLRSSSSTMLCQYDGTEIINVWFRDSQLFGVCIHADAYTQYIKIDICGVGALKRDVDYVCTMYSIQQLVLSVLCFAYMMLSKFRLALLSNNTFSCGPMRGRLIVRIDWRGT